MLLTRTVLICSPPKWGTRGMTSVGYAVRLNNEQPSAQLNAGVHTRLHRGAVHARKGALNEGSGHCCGQE